MCRDIIGHAIIARLWARNALPPLNRARRLVGLPEVQSPFQQYDTAARVLVLASGAFDWPSQNLPSNVRHVGTPGDKPDTNQRLDGLINDGAKPLVVVALSTLDQGQTTLLKKILVAVSDLPIQALVTVGPSLDPKQFQPARNTRLERFVPHDLVLPHAAALVTQCGIGTLTKALRHGVPMVCLPLVGDQHDNAARIVGRGAGLRLGANASPDRIRAALIRITTEEAFKEGARILGKALALERDPAKKAADEIEQAARPGSMG